MTAGTNIPLEKQTSVKNKTFQVSSKPCWEFLIGSQTKVRLENQNQTVDRLEQSFSQQSVPFRLTGKVAKDSDLYLEESADFLNHLPKQIVSLQSKLVVAFFWAVSAWVSSNCFKKESNYASYKIGISKKGQEAKLQTSKRNNEDL